MSKTATSKTLADDIYLRIRADILGGRLAVGQRLKLQLLAGEYGASLNIVREALSRLAGERLVKAQPQQGFSVVALTADELQDLTFVRIEIETIALRRCMEIGGVEWQAKLLAAHHLLANTPVRLPTEPTRLNEAYIEAHAAFHEALVSSCGSPMLLEMRKELHDASELYRRLAYLKVRVHKEPAKEHKRLVDAALAGDVEKASKLLAKHYEDTTRICMEAGLCQGSFAEAA